MTLLAVLAALAVGYLLGRARLGHRASDWAHWLIYGRNFTRPSWRWWLAQLVFVVEISGMLLAHPVRTVSAWKHRHDPPPPRSPAPQLRDLTEDAR